MPPQDQDPLARWEKPASPTTSRSAPDPLDRWSKAAQAPPDTPDKETPSGNFMNRPISDTLFGTSATKKYEEALSKVFPESLKGDKGAGWWARFTKEVAKGGPEMLDFIQSPTGAALTAAHLFPATAPFAAIVDIGLGGTGIMESIPQVKKALSDGSPESWADAFKGIAFSAGMLKGGMHTAASNAIRYRAEPLESREGLRSRIQKEPAQAADLAKIATKYQKSIPVDQIIDWARKPLSEIEREQKSAKDKYLDMQRKFAAKAKEEGRKMSGSEVGQLRAAALPARLLKDIAQVTLPEKVNQTEASRPTVLSRAQKLYYNAWGREPAKLVNIPKPRLMQVSADIVFDRMSRLNRRNFDINRMLYDWKKTVPLDDRSIQKMGYVIQGSATPEEVGLSAQARKMLPVIKDWVRNQDALLREAYGNNLSLQDSETYLTQIWKPKDGQWTQEGLTRAARTLMNDPFLKRRVIESYKKGIEELGLEPKYNDVFDLLKVRADFASKAIENRRMANWLRDLGAILSEGEYTKLRPGKATIGEQSQTSVQGTPYGYRGPKFSEWRQAADSTALYRAAYSNQPMDAGMILKPVYIHPDFADAANAVFGKGSSSEVFSNLDTMRALGKKVALNFSMFHNWALSEQAHAIFATRKSPLSTLSKTFFFNPEFYRGVKSGLWEAIGRQGDDPPVMRAKPEAIGDAIDHGLNLKSEEQEHVLYTKLQEMANNQNAALRTIGKAAKPLAKVLSGWDKALWDYYHQGMMLDAYNTIASKESPKWGSDPAKIKEGKRAIAEHLNNAFGAMSYEKMLVSPKMRQALNFLFLAPSWTLSNIRVLTSGYENEASANLVRRYVTGAAASWFVTTQAMNYATTGYYKKDENGKPSPHFTWENKGLPVTVGGHRLDFSENAFNIFNGYNQDGSESYTVLGKGFRDPLMWLLDPFQTFWGKVSLPVRGALTEVFGEAPGTGFKEFDINAPISEQMPGRVKVALESVGAPFALQEPLKAGLHAAFPGQIPASTAKGSLLPGLPTRKGVSYMRVEKAFRDAMDDGDEGLAIDILSVGADSGIRVDKIRADYIAAQKRKERTAAGPPTTYDTRGNPIEP